MCNANDSIISKVQELMELRKMIEELQNEAEIITDQIKDYMQDEETMMAGSYKVTWKTTVCRRVDTAALKKVLGDALDEYTKTITTRPFKVI
jgi:predicted phage-related endonuclease